MSPRRSIQPLASAIIDAFADSDRVVVGLVDLDGRLLAGNAGVARVAGRPLERVIGSHLWDALVRPEDEPMVRAVLNAIAHGAPAMSAENPWQRPDGTLAPMRWFNIPIRDESGQVHAVLGFGHEAEYHEALQARVEEAEQRFRMLEAAIDEVFYISDLAAGRLQYASPGFERLWEYPVRSLMADVRLFLERVHPDDRAAMTDALARQLAGERTEQEYRLLFPDGRIRWIRDRSYPILDRHQVVTRVVGVASDVTAHRATVDQLADRERLFSTVFESSMHALWLLDTDGRVLQANSTAHQTFKMEEGAAFATLPWGAGNEHSAIVDMLATARRGGRVRRDVRLGGPRDTIVLDVAVQPVASASGETRYILVEALDITQRIIDRRERDEAEQRLALAFEATSEGVWDWSLADGSAFYSPRWCRNLGYRPDEMPPRPDAWCDLLHPDDHEEACRTLRELLDGHADRVRIEVRLRMKNGGWFWALTRGRVVERDANGRPLRVVGTDTDIGPLKQVEERIRALNESLEQRVLDRTEALAKANRAKDEFMAVMSHELRTPMMAILGVAESMSDAVYGPLNDAQREALGLLEASGQHLLDLIGDLLDLAKLDAHRLSMHIAPVVVADLVADVGKLMAGLAARRGQTLVVSVPHDAGLLEGDAVRMRQILVNLLANAIKFTPNGGRVALTVRSAHEQVTFEVEDSGPGLPMDELDRLFRPFEQLDMQLARKYGGIGLGLALVHRLTALHAGSILVRSAPGGGARFDVTLPRRIAPSAPDLGFGGLALVIGESDLSNQRRVDWLEAAGFRVTQASDLDEAAARIALQQPDLVLVDADACPLAVVANETLRRCTVVVIMSVVTESWRNALHEAFGADVVLEAPCSSEQLQRAIERALAHRA